MQQTVMIIGAGPAGLMAAEYIQSVGYQAHVYDAKPSACRKFLLAGIGGMNITHSEDYPDFICRYYDKAQWLDPTIRQFDATALREWIQGLGIETFVGTSGRVFPKEMKAAPLLRNWLKRLRDMGVVFHMRYKMLDLQQGCATFEHENQSITVEADAIVLALGGASWPKLGSDGSWQSVLAKRGIELAPLESANCGFYAQWSEYLQTKFAGEPLKNVSFSVSDSKGEILTRQGECILTQDGMEGSLVYAFSKYFRDAINQTGEACFHIDLLPSLSEEQIIAKLCNTKAKESFSKYLKRTVGISGVKAALLHECSEKEEKLSPERLARVLKMLPVRFYQTKPIDEVISSAGGVCESSVNEYFMLKKMPGIFCAGEMLDWEAPTGGYLLTACFATGRRVGEGVCRYLL